MTFNNIFLFHSKSGGVYFTPSPLANIALCMDFMGLVLHSYQRSFHRRASSSGRTRIIQSDLAQYRRLLPQFAALYSRHFQYHPSLEFFFRQYRDHRISLAGDYERTAVCSQQSTCIDGFDDFIAHLRREAPAADLKKRAADWSSKSHKNQKRWLKFESDLFHRHEAVSVVCVSLSYQVSAYREDELRQKFEVLRRAHNKEYANYLDGYEITTLPDAKYPVAFDQIQVDRTKLFGNLKGKTSIFRHLAGYLWCIDTNPISGYRLQVALFLTSQTANEARDLALAFNRYWDTTIASTPGASCVLDVDRLFQPMALGLHPIGRRDQVRREAIRNQVIPELFGFDRPFNCRPYKQAHLFGTGLIRRFHPSLSSALIDSTVSRLNAPQNALNGISKIGIH